MSPRDDMIDLLHEVITQHVRGEPDFHDDAFTNAADAIIESGWWKWLNPNECETHSGHEFNDTCGLCGISAREYIGVTS